MIGQKFLFLNYYKQIPVSYDATLLNVEKEMAEFTVHEYQAKIINIQRQALIYSHHLSPFSEDICGDAFYVNSSKKRAILCRFGFVRVRSVMRNYVRVHLDTPLEVALLFAGDTIFGNIQDISISGASIQIMTRDLLEPGLEINLRLKLPDIYNKKITEVETRATIVRLLGNKAPFNCIVEFQPDKYPQQQLSHYIHQRQVEIIKELKSINA